MSRQAPDGDQQQQVPLVSLSVAQEQRPMLAGGGVHRHPRLEHRNQLHQVAGCGPQHHRLVRGGRVGRRSAQAGQEQERFQDGGLLPVTA